MECFKIIATKHNLTSLILDVDLRKYKNVRPSELWEVYGRFGEGLPADMETIMRSWTDQPGYPLISVTVKQSEGIATLHQVLYFYNEFCGCMFLDYMV